MGLAGPSGRTGPPGLPGKQGNPGNDGKGIKGDRVSFFYRNPTPSTYQLFYEVFNF